MLNASNEGICAEF